MYAIFFNFTALRVEKISYTIFCYFLLLLESDFRFFSGAENHRGGSEKGMFTERGLELDRFSACS